MAKTQFSGMKMVARVAGQGVRIRRGQTACDIQRIADQRMSCCCQMDPYLMGPACGDANIAQEGIRPAFENSHLRQGRLAVRRGGMN